MAFTKTQLSTVPTAHLRALRQTAACLVQGAIPTQEDIDALRWDIERILEDADMLDGTAMTQEDADIVEHACNG